MKITDIRVKAKDGVISDIVDSAVEYINRCCGNAIGSVVYSEEDVRPTEKFLEEEIESCDDYIKERIEIVYEPVEFSNLDEIQGQESGVIVYGDEVIICNWSSADLDGLPKLFEPLGLISLKEKFNAEKVEYCENLLNELDGKNVIYDFNNDFETLSNTGGMKFNIYVDGNIQAVVYMPDDYVNYNNSLQSCATTGKAIATELKNYASSDGPIKKLMDSLGLKSMNPASLKEYNNKVSNVQQYFMKSSKTASEIYTQNMLVNAYRRSLERYPASLDGSSELIAQASEQSLTKMKLAHHASYQVAGKTLPALHTVLLVLMVGIFPIMVMAMFIREVAWSVVKNYITVLFSLMMWPVLFAVFNSIITTLNAQVMHGEGFTLSNMDKVKENATMIAGMASWLLLSIPFLSFKLVTNLGQNIASAGSYLGNALASSTSADAAATATGNYNWGNMQMNNINGNKVDLNSVYRDGMSTVQLANGATQTMTADGSMVLDSSGSISKLPFSFDTGRMLDASLNSSIQALQRQSEQYMQGYRSSLTNAHDSAVQILSNYSHQDLRQKGLQENDIHALKNAAQSNDSATSRNASDYSTNNSVSNSLNLRASGGLGGGKFGGNLGFGGDFSNNDNVGKSENSSYSYSHDKGWSNAEIAEKAKQLNQINASNIQDSQLRSLIRNTQDSMRNAYENFSGFTATQSRERVLSETANLTESQRMNIQHRLEQEFVGYARTRLGDENVGYVLTSGTAEAREQRTQLINEYAAQFEASLRNIHDGNGVKVLGSQGGFSGGNSGVQDGFKGGVSGGQVENYVGSRGQSYEEQAKKMGIQIEPIQHIDPNSERNQEVKSAWAKKSGSNQVRIDEAEDHANIRKQANEKIYEKRNVM